jgi:hypothetical protein
LNQMRRAANVCKCDVPKLTRDEVFAYVRKTYLKK